MSGQCRGSTRRIVGRKVLGGCIVEIAAASVIASQANKGSISGSGPLHEPDRNVMLPVAGAHPERVWVGAVFESLIEKFGGSGKRRQLSRPILIRHLGELECKRFARLSDAC